MKIERFKIYEDRKDVTLTGYIIGDSPELLNGKARPGGTHSGLSADGLRVYG